MTPTEQDKELFENSFGEWLENHGVELIGNNPSQLGTWRAMVDMNELKLAIMQLIIADRKRVALEARLEVCDKYLSFRAASDTEYEAIQWLDFQRDELNAELKAQQEQL